MARKRYIETHSNYVLKKLHQTTSDGSIFERDHMTISEMDSMAPGQVPIYQDSNFKFSVRNSVTNKVKHKYGTWLTNNICGTESQYWTDECLQANDKIETESSKIRLRGNHTTLLDFACYGSVQELIRASLSDIILKYPGELFLSNEEFTYYANENAETLTSLGMENGVAKHIVKNPFNIDIVSTVIKEDENTNELRYFSKSFDKYTFIPDQLSEYHRIGWTVNKIATNLSCLHDGDLVSKINIGECTLYYYYYQGSQILLHDYAYGTAHIRPNDSTISDFFNSIDDFEYFLLDRKTKYKVKLQTPQETDKGIYSSLEEYQWPTSNGWNLDFESRAYTKYVNGLLSIGELYDNLYSDNIVRSLTHEAIKNFDWTNTNETKDGATEEYNPNPERIESVLRIYGRQFDEIKRYAYNIRNSRVVSYNNENNSPAYFSSDLLSNAGWRVKDPLSFIDNSIVSATLYPGLQSGYTADEASTFFMKDLLLNSRAILNAKGTKRGLEMMLAMFGFRSIDWYKKGIYTITESGVTKHVSWNQSGLTASEQAKLEAIKRCCYGNAYEMNEFIGVANDSGSGVGYSTCEISEVERINSQKQNFRMHLMPNEDYESLLLQGLPVKQVSIGDEDGNTQSYLVPWFDKSALYDDIDNAYFQSKGAWGRSDISTVNVSTYGSMELASGNGFENYDETKKYLHFADTMTELRMLSNLKIENGDIYYVEDITNVDNNNQTLYSDIPSGETLSHYFVLINKDYSDILGKDSESNWGWQNITEEDLAGAKTSYAKMALYLESIVDTSEGNNPHVGYGKYDNGEEYIERFRKIFGHSRFDGAPASKIVGKDNVGFNIAKEIDNQKCWYFTDTYKDGSLFILSGNSQEEYTQMFTNDIKVGTEDEDQSNGVALRKTALVPYNMENKISGKTYDEAAANSIINLKNFELNFYPNSRLGFNMYDFINDVVLFYVKQLIPSTTLLSYHVPNVGFDAQCGEGCTVDGITTNNYTISAGEESTEEPYISVFVHPETLTSESGSTIAVFTTNDKWFASPNGDKYDILSGETNDSIYGKTVQALSDVQKVNVNSETPITINANTRSTTILVTSTSASATNTNQNNEYLENKDSNNNKEVKII